MRSGELFVQAQPPKCPANKVLTDAIKGADRSKDDFKMCCCFFEANPDSDIAEAKTILQDRFTANHGSNQARYQNL